MILKKTLKTRYIYHILLGLYETADIVRGRQLVPYNFEDAEINILQKYYYEIFT